MQRPLRLVLLLVFLLRGLRGTFRKLVTGEIIPLPMLLPNLSPRFKVERGGHRHMCVCINMYINIHINICIFIYIYIFYLSPSLLSLHLYPRWWCNTATDYVYKYIYIFMYICMLSTTTPIGVINWPVTSPINLNTSPIMDRKNNLLIETAHHQQQHHYIFQKSLFKVQFLLGGRKLQLATLW